MHIWRFRKSNSSLQSEDRKAHPAVTARRIRIHRTLAQGLEWDPLQGRWLCAHSNTSFWVQNLGLSKRFQEQAVRQLPWAGLQEPCLLLWPEQRHDRDPRTARDSTVATQSPAVPRVVRQDLQQEGPMDMGEKDDRKSWNKVCQHQQKVEHIRMRTPSHGKILLQPTSKRASSILQVMLKGLLSSSSWCQSRIKSSIWSGSRMSSRSIERSRRMKESLLSILWHEQSPSILLQALQEAPRWVHAQHRCTLCLSKHAPFQWARAQVNGGVAKPNWAKQEYKLARTEDRAPDLRWDRDQAPPSPPPPADAPSQEAQQQAPLPSNVRPSIIHENREWTPQAQEEQPQHPQPGYRTPADIWNLDIESRSNLLGPMASFLRHVATMQSPDNPSNANLPVHPVKEARELQREATLENVAEYQRYLESSNLSWIL